MTSPDAAPSHQTFFPHLVPLTEPAKLSAVGAALAEFALPLVELFEENDWLLVQNVAFQISQ